MGSELPAMQDLGAVMLDVLEQLAQATSLLHVNLIAAEAAQALAQGLGAVAGV